MKWGRIKTLLSAMTIMLSTGVANAANVPSCTPSSIKSILSRVESLYGPIIVISAYRPNARIAGTRRPSYHASCRAIDFHPARGSYRQVINYLRRNHDGGLGTYSVYLHHIHIDNGPYIRFHHSTGRSAWGKRKRYRRR